jgi:hypothetical protein
MVLGHGFSASTSTRKCKTWFSVASSRQCRNPSASEQRRQQQQKRKKKKKKTKKGQKNTGAASKT